MEEHNKLQIVYQGWSREERERKEKFIEYELYEINYVAAIRHILHEAMNQEKWAAENEKRMFKNEKKNILAFIGGRGSGKTTAIDEFCRILDSMDQEENGKWWIRYVLEPKDRGKLKWDDFKFYVVQPIDASLLGEDDLFELILVNIFRHFEKNFNQDSCYAGQRIAEINDIIKLYQEIFKEYHVTQSDKLEKLQSSISLYHLMSGSYEIQKKVAQLIDKLLLLNSMRFKFEYIVITIDDLDLNLTYGYKMLEVLQKYFSYHKIIILAAIDYEQMSLVCEEHFEKHMPNTTKKNRGILRNEYVRILSNDYMTKIFPLSQRLYMPDFKSVMKNIIISNHGIEVPVKQYIMVKIARKMKIYYDACGLKWHFCEPNTVRELVSYNDFLDSLLDIKFEGLEDADVKRISRQYNQNYEMFHRDIVLRMAQNMLMPQQKEVFLELTKRDLERRAMYFASMKIINDNNSNIQLSMKAIDGHNYTYGDVLEKIYDWGRIYFAVKPLLHCVMASITSEMTREYIEYYLNNDGSGRAKSRLLGFLGNSFGNEWCGGAFPKVRILVNNSLRFVYYGYRSHVLQQFISVVISMKALDSYSQDLDIDKKKEIIRKWIQEEKIVETLECINLFFVKNTNNVFENVLFRGTINMSDVKDSDNLEWIWDDLDNYGQNGQAGTNDEKAPKEAVYNLEISGCDGALTMDIMAFVARTIDYEDQRQRIQKHIAEVLSEGILSYFKIKENITAEETQEEEIEQTVKEVVKEVVIEESLFTKNMKENTKYETAFPFYNLDMSYNIWKRARRKFCDQFVEEEQVYQAVRDLFNYIKELLGKEEEFYGCGNEAVFNYKKNFSNCPYVKAIENLDSDGIVVQRLLRIFRMVTTGPYEPENVRD